MTWRRCSTWPLRPLADFYNALVAKGVTKARADLVRTRVVKVLRLTKAERISDLAPSAVQVAIDAIRKEGLALQTCNDTLRAVKQFGRWLWRDGRAREHVLAHLTGYNVALVARDAGTRHHLPRRWKRRA